MENLNQVERSEYLIDRARAKELESILTDPLIDDQLDADLIERYQRELCLLNGEVYDEF